MPSPKDPSKLPAWWKPNRVKPRSLYQVVGDTPSVIGKKISVVAVDEIEAARVCRDQFYYTKISSLLLLESLVWA